MLRFRFGRSRPWHKSGAERRRDALTVRGAVGGWTLSKRDKPTPESPPHRKARTTDSVDASQITTSVEVAVGISLKDLTNLYLLLSVKGFGPQKFRELHLSQIPATEALENPERLPAGGKRWDGFRSDLGGIPAEMRELCHRRAVRQILTAHKLGASVLTYDHPSYPLRVYNSNDPIPILYTRGSLDVLQQRNAVACVGSRKIRAPYSALQTEFIRHAVGCNFTIVSGFALGADTISHETAYRNGGRTICVMPGGLERPFPPENRKLWDELLCCQRALFVSEFPFGMRASALTLRKRNKLIVAFSQGVLISQSSVNGGAMNAYRFAREQRKPVATFADDGMPDTSGNRLISHERRPEDEMFADKPELDSYSRWLQRLSSST